MLCSTVLKKQDYSKTEEGGKVRTPTFSSQDGTLRTPGSFTATLGEFLSKQEATHGSETASNIRGRTTNSPPASIVPSAKTVGLVTPKKRAYLLPTVEQALLLWVHLKNILYFQP